MEKPSKKITTVFVDVEVLEHVKNNPKVKNLSEWINLKYPEEFMNLKREEEKLLELKTAASQCQKRIEVLKSVGEQTNLPELADKWIKNEGIRRYKSCLEGYVSFEGILKFFNRKFDLNINQRQFKILLEKAKDGM